MEVFNSPRVGDPELSAQQFIYARLLWHYQLILAPLRARLQASDLTAQEQARYVRLRRTRDSVDNVLRTNLNTYTWPELRDPHTGPRQIHFAFCKILQDLLSVQGRWHFEYENWQEEVDWYADLLVAGFFEEFDLEERDLWPEFFADGHAPADPFPLREWDVVRLGLDPSTDWEKQPALTLMNEFDSILDSILLLTFFL